MDEIKRKVLGQMKDEVEAMVEAFEMFCHECHVSPESCPAAKIAKRADPKYQHDGYFCRFDKEVLAEKIIERAVELTLKVQQETNCSEKNENEGL